jgi:hypothetical protein
MEIESEIRRVARLLEIEIRLANTSKRAIEKKLGWAPGYLTKVIKGGLELRVRHVLAVASAAGFSVGEFFAKTFPSAPVPEWREEITAKEQELGQAIDRVFAHRFAAQTEALQKTVHPPARKAPSPARRRKPRG